jgi:hypothetical protein
LQSIFNGDIDDEYSGSDDLYLSSASAVGIKFTIIELSNNETISILNQLCDFSNGYEYPFNFTAWMDIKEDS